MILLCGIPSEPPLALVQAALDDLSTPYVWFNQRRCAAIDFEWAVTSGGVEGVLEVAGDIYPLAAFTGVYQRLMDDSVLPELAKMPESAPARRRCRALHEALTQWMEVAGLLGTRVVNRVSAMTSNFSKPYQTQLLARYGLLVPPTLITNDPALVRQFLAEHGAVIFKSISGVRSIVRQLQEEEINRLEAIRWCPTQFQAFVSGLNVRVHVVGHEVFATAALTEATDYRYAQHEAGHDAATLQPFALPAEIAARCVSAAAALELPFAGVDLKITPDGHVYCFEINPSPAFSYYQNHTGQPIATAVAHYLRGA